MNTKTEKNPRGAGRKRDCETELRERIALVVSPRTTAFLMQQMESGGEANLGRVLDRMCAPYYPQS